MVAFVKKTYFAFHYGQPQRLLQPAHHNEQSLLSQVAEGNEGAFTQLFHRYHHKLGAYIYQLTSSRELAEEVVLDVFMKVWNDREALKEVEHFSAWLYRISRNHALNARRDNLRRLLREKEAERNLSGETEDDFLAREEQFHLIEQAINQLPPQQKKVFIMSRYQRLKYEEIAREMNISRETVKSYLQVAHTSIRKFILGHSPIVVPALLLLFFPKNL